MPCSKNGAAGCRTCEARPLTSDAHVAQPRIWRRDPLAISPKPFTVKEPFSTRLTLVQRLLQLGNRHTSTRFPNTHETKSTSDSYSQTKMAKTTCNATQYEEMCTPWNQVARPESLHVFLLENWRFGSCHAPEGHLQTRTPDDASL